MLGVANLHYLHTNCHEHETTKTRRFFNKTRTSVGLVSNINHETRKIRIRRRQMQIKIQQYFITQNKQNKVMTRKCTQN
jgi:hypothetical protein